MDIKIIGNYKIESSIAEGGMGEVYYGKHVTLNREVAIKKLHSNLTNNPQFRERFINEAVILAKLSNPYIVNIYDLLEHEGEYYIIMEFVKGIPISDLVGNVQIPIERKLNIFKKILLGVDFAHENGIIHRDIKPSNILLDENDNPKILDFGIAKLVDADHSMTKTGMKMGSVYYMSPEQVLGQDINRQSDVYSLGVFLYELLTGSLPYSVNTESEYQIMESIVKQPIEEQRLQGLDESLKHIIYRATSKDQYHRFATCREFYDALETGVVGVSSGYIAPPSNQNSGSFAATRIMTPGAGKTQMMGQPSVQSGREQKRSKKGLTIVSSVIGVLILGTIVFYSFSNVEEQHESIIKNETGQLNVPQPTSEPESKIQHTESVEESPVKAVEKVYSEFVKENRSRNSNLSRFYNDRVHYFSLKSASKSKILADKKSFFKKWDMLDLKTSNMSFNQKGSTKVECNYDKEFYCENYSNGRIYSGKVRSVIVFEKINGEWLITKEADDFIYYTDKNY